ncbi:TolC family protein [Pedobacter deserti]|uniref:TolC family protein n=1 Tax=Pedobacter deserti TaxID=2817382 RepID=UPI00210DD0CB|nr:TolC family protein [Pedobacter sp. SYSU D00382]
MTSTKAIIVGILIYLPFTLHAQESILSDVSYLYMEKLIAVAKANYPRNKAFSSRVDVAKSNLGSAKASWLDPFSFSYVFRSNSNNVDLETGNLLLRGYQFGVTINPGTILRKPYDVKSARAQLAIAKNESQEYEYQLEAEVKTRYVNYLQALNSLKLVTKTVVDTETSFKYIKARYERSEVSFQDYSSASVQLNSAYASKIDAEATLANAKFSLEELLTMKLEQVK